MIICPDCQHQNPDATHCEACDAPLPATTPCLNCGGLAQAKARFCGHCGFKFERAASVLRPGETPGRGPVFSVEPPVLSALEPDTMQELKLVSVPVPRWSLAIAADTPGNHCEAETQLQQQTAHLLHVQSDTASALPQTLTVIHIGKPNDRVPPDIDLAGFPNSEVVSRIHTDIRLEGDTYFIEDMDSANGTYINHTILPTGNRHRLRHGDRIALGKGDRVTFLFQLH